MSDRNGATEVFVMNADGTGQSARAPSAATDTTFRWLGWSGDGTRITFTDDRDGNLEIYVMNEDGTGQTRITTHASADKKPDWSPV